MHSFVARLACATAKIARSFFVGIIPASVPNSRLIGSMAILRSFVWEVILVVGLTSCGGGMTGNATDTSSSAGTVTLAWDAASASNLTGYRVYYGSASKSYFQPLGQGISVGSVTTYTITGLSSGQTYYFAVTAFDSMGNESNYSSEVSKAIP